MDETTLRGLKFRGGSNFSWMSKEKWFLEMESTLGKDAVKTIEMITKDLEYNIT